MFSKKAVTSISSSGQRRLWSASECQRWPRVGAGLCWRRGRAWPAGERLSAEAPERDPGHRRPQLKGEAGAGVLRPPTRPSGLRGGTALLAGTAGILLEQIPVSPGCAPLPSTRRGAPRLLRGGPGVTCARVRGRTRYGWQSAEGCAPSPVSLLPARSVLPWGPPQRSPVSRRVVSVLN